MPRRAVATAIPVTPPPAAVNGDAKPAHTIRIGLVRASIWKSDGSNGDAFTVTVDRQWREATGEWKDSPTFLPGDLRHLARAASECALWTEWQRHIVEHQTATH